MNAHIINSDAFERSARIFAEKHGLILMKGTDMMYDLRQRALELALGSYDDAPTDAVLERAEAFYNFLTQLSSSPRETINAALDKAGVK